jgi:hypothetical protein
MIGYCIKMLFILSMNSILYHKIIEILVLNSVNNEFTPSIQKQIRK